MLAKGLPTVLSRQTLLGLLHCSRLQEFLLCCQLLHFFVGVVIFGDDGDLDVAFILF